MRLSKHSVLGTLLALAGVVVFATAATATAAGEAKTAYVVQMIQDPAVAYEGGIAGLPATKPAKGKKIDPQSGNVRKYVDHLAAKHSEALAKVGGGQKLYDYAFSYNGFAANLTEAQADALRKQADVVTVAPSELVEMDTSSTPAFLGLDAAGGLWEQLGGPTVGKHGAGAGEDIVIGIVDSGIWPENPSFSDRDADGKRIYLPINTSKWHGRKCTPGEQFTASDCNAKLIGGQHFNAAWGGDAGIEALRPWEFTSVRDYNGHGSHTAGTAGGNHGVTLTGPAAAFGKASGIAPRARIAAYKALWSNEDASQASGQTADLVAAIDQAVADGVDVINYSISGSRTDFMNPVSIAMLFAADAGVFVSASAGNSGPTTSTVAHPGPWITTVAAGTHNRNGVGSVKLGNDVTYTGASVASAVGPADLIDSTVAGAAGADATQVALCYPGTLDSAKVSGKIVLCDRGVIARVDKSRAVQMAGGVGMILVNTSPSSINADFHFVPTVHLPDTNRAAVKAYAATAGATATINAATITTTDPAPFTASFSSRGPLQAGGGDLLKPDVIAPGQDILAAVAPPGNAGREFNLYSGTSMSAPHVAGFAALLKHKYPAWSPMAIKSALMTSAGDVLDGANTSSTVIFRQGAGHVRPNVAANPGLVYEHGFIDWLGFLCGTGQLTASYCPSIKIDPSDLNVASIAIGDLGGTQTVKRRVTNVGGSAATYTASYTGLGGFEVIISPSSLSLAPGETKEYSVSFKRTTAALNAYTGGQLTWSGDGKSVRSPVVLRPVALGAPAQVSGTGGPISYNVRFGYDGAFTATPRGLVAATTFASTVADDPTDSTCSLSSPNAVKHDVVVPAGTSYARFSLFDDFTDGDDDLDLCVFRGTTLVGLSGTGTSAEEVNLVSPTPATYTVVVQGWGTDGPDANFTLFYWLLGTADAGNMSVAAPSTATTGGTGAIGLSFTGLAPATKYLGSVAYGGSTGMPNPTIVRVDTP